MSDPSFELMRVEIARLSIMPGDLVLVTCPTWLPHDAKTFLREAVCEACETEKVLVLDGGIKIELISQAGGQA